MLKSSLGLENVELFDPTEVVPWPAITIHEFLRQLVRGSSNGVPLTAKPWPFVGLHSDIFKPSISELEWRCSFTQYPNTVLWECGDEQAILVAFQFIDNHFKALLHLALFVRTSNSLVLSLPKWRGRLSRQWQDSYVTKLQEIIPFDVSDHNARNDLFQKVERRRIALLDTFALRHPGNYVMNDLGPAISLVPLIKNSGGIIKLARRSCGWFSDKEEYSLLNGSTMPTEDILQMGTQEAIDHYCSLNSCGIIRLWGCSVTAMLAKRVNLLVKENGKSINTQRRNQIHIGIGLRSRDRRLVNITEVMTQIVHAFPKYLSPSLHFILHGSAKGSWLSDEDYFQGERIQSNSIKEHMAELGLTITDVIGQPLADQLAKLSIIEFDIVPVGTAQVKSLFYLKKPMIVHSPIGLQPTEHLSNPWLTVADLTYTGVWRGGSYENCFFIPKSYVTRVIDTHSTGNIGRADYLLDPTRTADLVYGFWNGIRKSHH